MNDRATHYLDITSTFSQPSSQSHIENAAIGQKGDPGTHGQSIPSSHRDDCTARHYFEAKVERALSAPKPFRKTSEKSTLTPGSQKNICKHTLGRGTSKESHDGQTPPPQWVNRMFLNHFLQKHTNSVRLWRPCIHATVPPATNIAGQYQPPSRSCCLLPWWWWWWWWS